MACDMLLWSFISGENFQACSSFGFPYSKKNLFSNVPTCVYMHVNYHGSTCGRRLVSHIRRRTSSAMYPLVSTCMSIITEVLVDVVWFPIFEEEPLQQCTHLCLHACQLSRKYLWSSGEVFSSNSLQRTL